jgi:hypothetical protein
MHRCPISCPAVEIEVELFRKRVSIPSSKCSKAKSLDKEGIIVY